MPIFKVGFVVVFDRRCKDTNNMWGLQELHERRKKGRAADSHKPLACKQLQQQETFFQPIPSPTRYEEQDETRAVS